MISFVMLLVEYILQKHVFTFKSEHITLTLKKKKRIIEKQENFD